MTKPTLSDTLRGAPWLAAALLAAAVVFAIAPHQIGVLIWSLSKLAFGAYLGYWIDRSIFYYARPSEIGGEANAALMQRVERMAFMLRRAVIMAAAILALGLGV